eukprot:Sspe_Gene.99602::Locus_73293_Transcript_1_1_Confidence_1.000_Length_1159::g.99602::m.99602
MGYTVDGGAVSNVLVLPPAPSPFAVHPMWGGPTTQRAVPPAPPSGPGRSGPPSPRDENFGEHSEYRLCPSCIAADERVLGCALQDPETGRLMDELRSLRLERAVFHNLGDSDGVARVDAAISSQAKSLVAAAMQQLSGGTLRQRTLRPVTPPAASPTKGCSSEGPRRPSPEKQGGGHSRIAKAWCNASPDGAPLATGTSSHEVLEKKRTLPVSPVTSGIPELKGSGPVLKKMGTLPASPPSRYTDGLALATQDSSPPLFPLSASPPSPLKILDDTDRTFMFRVPRRHTPSPPISPGGSAGPRRCPTPPSEGVGGRGSPPLISPKPSSFCQSPGTPTPGFPVSTFPNRSASSSDSSSFPRVFTVPAERQE